MVDGIGSYNVECSGDLTRDLYVRSYEGKKSHKY
jgi:hypothetical protein